MVTIDRVLDLLTPQRRRYALYYLSQQDEPVTIDEVVRQVATWEEDPSAITIPEKKYKKIGIEMRHNHAPRADEMEFIEYDRDSQTINLAGSPPTFEKFLTLAKVIEHPESKD